MSNYVYVTGELKWARTKEAETDPWGNTAWKVTVFLDKGSESIETVMDMQSQGIKNTLKKDHDTGQYFINFKRTAVDKKGKINTPPKVVDKDGNPLNDLIGNGSKGTVKLELRTFKLKTGGNGAAATLDTIKVDELVPYEAREASADTAGGFQYYLVLQAATQQRRRPGGLVLCALTGRDWDHFFSVLLEVQEPPEEEHP